MTFEESYRNHFEKIKTLIGREGLEAVARHNYGWHPDRFDLIRYLEISHVRYQIVVDYLQRFFPDGKASICDVGGFFGVFPAALKDLGYEVAITEKYEYYQGHFSGIMEYLEQQQIKIYDADLVLEDTDLGEKFDMITCMAVIEHLPDSPKRLFENFHKHLKPGGGLVIEVPNLAKLHKRLRFLFGKSILPPIDHIYESEVPFIGHHHEYTIQELKWLLNKTGFKLKSLDTHNYSKSKPKQALFKLLPKSTHEVIITYSTNA